jgi:Uma2 family endonuclease
MALPQITWQAVQQLPDDGKRHEAIGGELYGTPVPDLRHQRISMHLMIALAEIVKEGRLGEIFHAPLGVEFPATGEGVQPDLLFVSNERRGILAPEWLKGAPDLVVEIASPVTAIRDRSIKLDLYERQGVAEYWIVDPDQDAVEVWRFHSKPRFERFTGRLPVRLGEETVGEIDLVQVFARESR